jgi:hypothetical protein
MLEFAQSIRQIAKTHISFSKKEWPLESIVHGVGSYIVLLDIFETPESWDIGAPVIPDIATSLLRRST